MGGTFTQLFPPSPSFTETSIPSLAQKVFIVTGGNAGVGLEIAKILYSKGGTVYVASRSASKIAAEIEAIRSVPTATPGQLKSLVVDLGDLVSVASAASAFLSQETRLDVLFNNAGISQAPVGSTTVQGHEAHMGTNCLGPFFLTNLLLPILRQTAENAPRASVRVVWASSAIVDMVKIPGGLSLTELIPETTPGIKTTTTAPLRLVTGYWPRSLTGASG